MRRITNFNGLFYFFYIEIEFFFFFYVIGYKRNNFEYTAGIKNAEVFFILSVHVTRITTAVVRFGGARKT